MVTVAISNLVLIRKIKREHLPFITGLGKPLYTMKDVKDEPDNYL